MRRAGFFEESYSAREEESYHSEEEFHSSNASSGGMKLFQPSKCPTMAGHDAAGWNNGSNKFNHSSNSLNHQNGGWNNGHHDAHRFNQGHGMKPSHHGLESGGGMMNNGRYGSAAAYQKVQYPAAHTFVHEEEAMAGYNRFSGFDASFGGGHGGHNGCSNADWMYKAI